MALRRKLLALEYPHAESFQLENDGDLRNLIVWLEDTKIRLYKIEDRAALRAIDSDEWLQAFSKFLQDLDCPHTVEERLLMLDWLLGYAVSLSYSDDAETFASAGDEGDASLEDVNVDVNSPEFKAGVAELGKLLKLPTHDDPVFLLRAVNRVVLSKFTPQAVLRAESMKAEGKVKTFNLEDAPLGFETGDRTLDQAARVLRLLHIAELRELQTKVNELIASVQALVADPKTNVKLGKVGK